MSAIWPLIPFSCTPTLATLIYAAVLENHSVLTFVVRTIGKKFYRLPGFLRHFAKGMSCLPYA